MSEPTNCLKCEPVQVQTLFCTQSMHLNCKHPRATTMGLGYFDKKRRKVEPWSRCPLKEQIAAELEAKVWAE